MNAYLTAAAGYDGTGSAPWLVGAVIAAGALVAAVPAGRRAFVGWLEERRQIRQLRADLAQHERQEQP